MNQDLINGFGIGAVAMWIVIMILMAILDPTGGTEFVCTNGEIEREYSMDGHRTTIYCREQVREEN